MHNSSVHLRVAVWTQTDCFWRTRPRLFDLLLSSCALMYCGHWVAWIGFMASSARSRIISLTTAYISRGVHEQRAQKEHIRMSFMTLRITSSVLFSHSILLITSSFRTNQAPLREPGTCCARRSLGVPAVAWHPLTAQTPAATAAYGVTALRMPVVHGPC
jgi:hypothetical protein